MESRVKAAYIASLSILMLGCTTDRAPVTAGVVSSTSDRVAIVERCIPLRTKAMFSCWWSGPDAPLTHCISYAEDEPACGLKAKGGAYLSRGAPGGGNLHERPNGIWQLVPVYTDAEGRVGIAAERMDGTRFLSHHDQSPPPNGRPSEPVWPRWPAGLEFGPEQTARR